MKIFIAADHAGYELKKALIEDITFSGATVIDCGATDYNENDDYPLIIQIAAQAVSEAESARLAGGAEYTDGEVRGIVIGGSGQGEAIVANKFPHIRTTVYYGGVQEIITLSREHNDSNVLSLGARFISENEAIMAVRLWLGTQFSQEDRHVRRIDQIEEIEGRVKDTLY
ncbi:MAG: RpiB/LacA/LacB family sugar-phosphate isomerase [bacterium]